MVRPPQCTKYSFYLSPTCDSVHPFLITVTETKGGFMFRWILSVLLAGLMVMISPFQIVSAAEPLKIELQTNEIELSKNKMIIFTYATIRGGVPPYTVTASNDSITVNRGKLAGSYQVIAQKVGTAEIQVKDSTGATAIGSIKVVSPNAAFKAMLSDPVMDVGKTVTLTISGGAPPYSVDFLQPVRYKVERLAEGSYRLTGVTAGGGDIMIKDQKGRSTGASLRPAPFSMTIAKSSLTVGDETVLEIKGGTAPYQFLDRGASLLSMSPKNETQYRVIATGPGGPISLSARDAQDQNAFLRISVAPKPVPIDSQPLLLDVTPLKIHSDPKAVPPVSALLTIKNGKGPFSAAGGPFLTVEPVGPNQFKIMGKGQNNKNTLITVSDSEGRKGQGLVHLVPQFSGDCRTGPIKIGTAATFKITGGERAITVTGADPKIVRITQNAASGFDGRGPLEMITVQGLAPGSLTLMIHDVNNLFSLKCPVTVVP